MNEEQPRIQILDANIGATNIVDQQHIDDIVSKTINYIGEILEEHCGPYGSFAMITPNAHTPTAEPIFTKDGINIINACSFINPIEMHTRNMMAYIGRKVDSVVGDGTTSSMLISAKLVYAFKEYLKENKKTLYKDFLKAYDNFTETISKKINDISIVVDDKDVDLVRSVAYHQAMTSSHGNKELSLMIAELMSSIPKEAWRHLVYKREARETKDTFKIEIDDSSYSMEAMLFDNLMLNHHVNTEVYRKDVELYITSGPLISNGLEFDKLLLVLENRKVEDKHLVIVAEHANDTNVTGKLNTIFHTKRKEGIEFTLFRTLSINPSINDIEALYATTGHFRQKMIDQEIIFKDNIDISYKQGMVYIYGLVKYDENNIHPELRDNMSPASVLLKTIDEFLDRNKETRQAIYSTDVIRLAKQIANNIKCNKQGYILIGGNGYDNKAAEDVLKDVMSAVRESLTNGITLGGYKSLAQAIEMSYFDDGILSKTYEDVQSSKIYSLECIIGKAFLNAIYGMLKLLYVDKCPLTENNNKTITTEELIKANNISFDIISGETITFDIGNLKQWYNINPMIIQPKNTDIEFIKRFGEVVIKFLFTNKILIPDGVLVDKK